MRSEPQISMESAGIVSFPEKNLQVIENGATFASAIRDKFMNKTTIQITIPNSDLAMLKKLISGMGWSMSVLTKKKKAGIEKGLEDIKNGNVYNAENSADLVKQIFG